MPVPPAHKSSYSLKHSSEDTPREHNSAQVLADASLGPVLVLKEAKDPLILQSLQEDPTTDHESARRFAAIPGSQLRHLFHNKHELTWIKIG